KAAQLVRSCRALRDLCMAYEIPLLSGKDSMYVDGNLAGRYGETHKVSALETLQFSAISVIEDITRCITMDSKIAGDLIYVLGSTRNELGGSEYYEHLGYVGCNVPEVRTAEFLPLYRNVKSAIENDLVASAHGVYRGGLVVHMAKVAMGGNLGMHVNLGQVPRRDVEHADVLLFSESAGRFIVTVDPVKRAAFEEIFKGSPCSCIGTVTEMPDFVVQGTESEVIIRVPLADLKMAWTKTFGDLI
ncbi:MAG: AIR synthase-related protein, partial [Desulfobacterales bacterium]